MVGRSSGRSLSTLDVTVRTRDLDLGHHLGDERRRARLPHGEAAPRPDSSFERSRSCSTRRPSRSDCASITCSTSGLGCSTPSSRFSRWARIAVIGCLQLVRDVRDEVAARRLEVVELLTHAVEGRARAGPPRRGRGEDARSSSRRSPCAVRHRPCRAAAGSCRARAIAPSPSAITAAIAPASMNCHHTLCRNPSVAEIRPRNPRVGDGYSTIRLPPSVGGIDGPDVVADHAPSRHTTRRVGRQNTQVHAFDGDLARSGCGARPSCSAGGSATSPLAMRRASARASIASESRGEFRSANPISA